MKKTVDCSAVFFTVLCNLDCENYVLNSQELFNLSVNGSLVGDFDYCFKTNVGQNSASRGSYLNVDGLKVFLYIFINFFFNFLDENIKNNINPTIGRTITTISHGTL